MTKHLTTLAAAVVAVALPCYADQPAGNDEKIERHQEGSVELADEQDELSADVQQLALEQTVEKVIELLEEVEEAMDDASYRLEEHDTGGETIAAETDVIEKIYEAAKERQKSCSSGSCSGAMLDMMGQMMGKGDKGDKPGKKGEKPGEQGGEGQTGESDAANDRNAGDPDGRREERTLKKASGTAGRNVPAEFRKAFEAFNRGSEDLAK